MKQILLSLLCILLGVTATHAEVFKDSDYKYKITIPDGSVVNHHNNSGHNLNFILPDSTAVFYVYVLNVDEIPKDEYTPDDTRTVFRKDYIADLDKNVFKLLTDSVVATESRWIDEKQRIYYFEDGTQAITRTYYLEEYPHIVAVFGQDLDRSEVKATLDSFKTPKFEFTWWSIILSIVFLIVLFFLFLVFEDSNLSGLGSFFLISTIIWFFVLIIGGAIGLIKYIWYWT